MSEELCRVCDPNGEYGVFAIGVCRACRKPCCVRHLVVEAYTQRNEGDVLTVIARYADGSASEVRFSPSPDGVPDIYKLEWHQASITCTACRHAHALMRTREAGRA